MRIFPCAICLVFLITQAMAEAESGKVLELTASAGEVSPDPSPVYLPGGPLAGVVLPPFSRGANDESELYPNSVEHYRAYWFKFLPVRSFYDRQSQLKNWVLPEIPGVDAANVVEFVEPVYGLGNDNTGPMTAEKLPLVKVLRLGVKDPVFKLDLGTLETGVYNLRVVGAVDTKELRPFLEPLFLTMKLNNGPGGEVKTWRLKVSYVDALYSVAEFPFHVLEKRAYTAELYVDEGSKVTLLARNISLDDTLAGVTRRAVKTEQTLTTPADQPDPTMPMESSYPPSPEILDAEARLERDAQIWNRIPEENVSLFNRAQLDYPDGATLGVPGKTEEEIEAEWGAWKPKQGSLDGTMLINEKLNLTYSVDDLNRGRPLPDPYPYKDDGRGLYFPDETNPSTGKFWMPIARAMRDRADFIFFEAWKFRGGDVYARDAAVELLREAFQYPTLDTANSLLNLIAVPGSRGRDARFRQRYVRFYHHQGYTLSLRRYDMLYPHIKGNEELAKSISRFVPWVKTSDDLVKLMDMYLVQTQAKEVMRFQTVNSGWTAILADFAAVLGGKDREVTLPMMQWLWTSAWVYPLATAGLPDYLVTGYDRNGVQLIGSRFYAASGGAGAMAAAVGAYITSGGDPTYDLGNLEVYPKSAAHSDWLIDTVVGGYDFLRIGDVGGPEKVPGFSLQPEFRLQMVTGWELTRSPRFAWMLKYVYGRKGESDADWKAIEEGAAKITRAPWLDLRSRDLANWATVLESGLEHDDYRFRRTVYLRTGLGLGHNHADTLDMQGFAHGVPWTIDDGQRSGYSKPNSRFSRVHNTVEVDGKGNDEFGLHSYSWVENLSDAPGAPFMSVQAVPPPNATLFQRQVALVTVDEGKGSQPLSPEQQLPGAVLPQPVTTANSYVFDVFRVRGGSAHLYNFHGPLEDEFKWNVTNEEPVPTVKEIYDVTDDANTLSSFSVEDAQKTKFSGDAPNIFEATWRLTREGKWGTEQLYLGKNFNPDAPRIFTRLHVLNADGHRGLRADAVCSQLGYRFTATTLIRRGEDLESAFAAIIEPFVGEPFITSLKMLEVEKNETDAQRAIAVEVKTRNGSTDVNLADGRPGTTRKMGSITFAGEYGLVSKDEKGVRQATLCGGTILGSSDVKIAAATREYTATVIKVNYLKKQITLDKPLPAASTGRSFQIGTPEKWTSFTSAKVEGPTVTVTHGADFLRSTVSEVAPDGTSLTVSLAPTLGFGNLLPTGGWTVTNDDATKTWRPTEIAGNKYTFDIPVTMEDFGNPPVLRVWEYGVGDTVRLSTFLSVRRVEAGYEVTGDVDGEVTIAGKTHKISAAELARGPATISK